MADWQEQLWQEVLRMVWRYDSADEAWDQKIINNALSAGRPHRPNQPCRSRDEKFRGATVSVSTWYTIGDNRVSNDLDEDNNSPSGIHYWLVFVSL